MKKLTLLFALLCASVMGWSTQYCETVLTGDHTGSTAGEWTSSNGQNLTFTASRVGTTNKTLFKLTSTTSTITGLYVATLENAGGGSTSNFNVPANTDLGGWSVENGVLQKEVEWDTYPTGLIQVYLVARRSQAQGGSDIMGAQIFNVDVSSACTSKADPELSLNATSKTLEIDATAETFQIVADKAAGSGSISYSSNAGDVATVSNTGLVTAVGAGTATITVSVAENDDYAADSKTLTVEVIDWPNVEWLQNSGDSYKLHISPAIADGFGGKRIENGNIWVGCPSAEFGACSIDFTHVGAGASFPLSNFTKARSQFTLVCQGTTYTFTVYRKFDGVNLAKNMPTYAGATALPKAEANDGNKGSRWASGGGAKHYPTYKDMAEDWWVVDLGAFYEISSIKTLFEGATPKNYSFYTSPNNDSWVEIDSYNATPKAGNTDADYNEYTYSPGKVGRYVKLFAREAVQADFAYGISMWEFEVYGQPAEGYDVNAPVLASAALSGTPTDSQVQIAVSATDAEGAVTIYRVKDTGHGIDHNCTAAAGIITIDDLSEGTDYSFTITALDAIGNQSNAIVVNASTADDMTMPQTAAPTPSATGKDVLAIYCDAFPNILAHSFDKDGFAGMPLYEEKNIGGDNCLIYDRSGSAPVYTTWGMYDDGANAIIAATGYSDPNDAGHKGVYAADMKNLHIDIWSLQACATILVRINDGARTGDLRLSHNGEGWQSYDIPLNEFVAGANINNVRWFKFEALDAITGKVAIDNVYFWKAESGNKSVSVSVNNGTMGSASAKVGDDDVTLVTTGTEVTFTATPNSGYSFINWTKSGVEVSTSATYVLEVTENTALVANFEAERTAYCSTPVTDTQSRTLYLTISKTDNENEYKILFEGSAGNKIRGNNVYVGTGLTLTNVNGESSYTFNAASGAWHVSTEGFGSAYITFTATNFRNISFVNKGVDLFRDQSSGGNDLSSFNAFPDASLIKWDATCTDDEAPVLAAPVATVLSGTSVRLAVSATDNMAALLSYSVNYKPEGDTGAGTNVQFNGTAGETTSQNIKGLTAGVRYEFTVTVSDGTNVSDAQVCYATPSMPAAPVPTHNAAFVRSVYSDTYESALAHGFIKNNWSWISYSEQSVGGDNMLVYTNTNAPAQMPDVAWGTNNDGSDAIIAKDGFNDGVNKGLDVRQMHYIHFDIWSSVATNYPEVYLNDTHAGGFHLNNTGWQSFDIDISSLTDEQKTNIRWIKFIAFRDPGPEEIVIDNVYFWSYGVTANPAQGTDAGGWATFAAPVKLAVPSGLTAYKASYENTGTEEILNLTSIAVIPANEGVILKGTAGQNYLFAPTDAADPDMSGNVLVGCPVRTDVSSVRASQDIFCMRYSGSYDMTGFFLYEGQYVPAGKAYLPLAKTGPSSAPRKVRFVINNEQTTTGIEKTGADAVEATKYIENGQLFIRRGEAVYTIEGVRVK